MSRAVIYVRVSTQEQVSNGAGLDIQLELCEAFCAEQALEVVGRYEDAGQSGAAALEHRIGLGDALSEIENGTADELVVADLSRLARDLIVQESVLATILEAGGQLRSSDAQEDAVLRGTASDDESASRTFIRQVLGAAKQYDRAMIRLRLTRGLRAKKLAGGYIGGGVGYGAKLVDDRIVVDEASLEVLQVIAEQRLEGANWRDVAAELTARGWLAPRGGEWEANSARRAYLRYCKLTGRTPVGRMHQYGPRPRRAA